MTYNNLRDKIKKQQEYKSYEKELDFINREIIKLDDQVAKNWYRLDELRNKFDSDSVKLNEKNDQLTKSIKFREDFINDCLKEKEEKMLRKKV